VVGMTPERIGRELVVVLEEDDTVPVFPLQDFLGQVVVGTMHVTAVVPVDAVLPVEPAEALYVREVGREAAVAQLGERDADDQPLRPGERFSDARLGHGRGQSCSYLPGSGAPNALARSTHGSGSPRSHAQS